ncbi:MAG TPA: penicillin-binding protein 2 [Myxococcaceae bacterium]|nr:penicillin-binding protein 2 [Myxococcaceae bacterium]
MTLGQNSAGKDLKARYLWLGLAMVAGLLLLAGRLYRLQIARGDEYSAKSVANFVKEIRVKADRGIIKDRRGEILVDSRPSFDVFITPAFCERCSEEVLPRLSGWLSWDGDQQAHVEQLLRAARRSAPFQPVPVQLDLNRDELDTLNAHKLELAGVDWPAVPHRNYRTGTVLPHVVGYMNEITQDELERLNSQGEGYALGDFIGRRGVERFFERRLRGKDGSRKEVVNARGETIQELSDLITGEATLASTPGDNVVLSIDMRLQAEAERAFPGTAGAVVAMDVRTGFILAMVSRPGFDPNVLTGRVTPAQLAALNKDPLQPMIFRPTQQHYSPGSTFKTLSMFAALSSNSFTPHSTVSCAGGYRLGARLWRCHKDSGHGLVDARRALQQSCDTWFYKVADTLGLDPIAAMGRSFGLGAPTGVAVVAEVPGIMPDSAYHDRVTPGGYTKGLALNSVIGQGDVNVTPLQLAMAYAAVANGGHLYKPQLVRRLEMPDGRMLQEFQPQVIHELDLDPDARRLVVDALTAVVNEPGGTAYRSRLPDVKMAGKTGTAQVVAIGKTRIKKEAMTYWQRDHAWFAAFAPAEDPEIAVVVLNEHGGHGGNEAAPTASALIKKYFELKREDANATIAASTALPVMPVRPPPPPPTPRPPPVPEELPVTPAAAPSVAQVPAAASEGAR